MKTIGFSKNLRKVFVRHAIIAVASAVAMNASFGFAAPEDDLNSHLSGASLLNATPAQVINAVNTSVSHNPAAAPDYVRVVLLSRNDADVIASQVAGAAVRGLGDTPSRREVGQIVFQAVKATPDAVLDIVRTVAPLVPKDYAADIVVAAVSAVPDPYKTVVYTKVSASVENAKPDYKDFKDTKTVRDDKAPAPIIGESMPLAEAIAHAVADATGADLAAMLAAAESALSLGVNALFTAISNPTALSGVGIAGDTNFANEPRVSAAEEPPGSDSEEPPPVSR